MQFDPVRTNRVKQEIRPTKIPPDTPCGYCFQVWATGYDHIIPWIAGGSNDPSNLYPCCRSCNSLLRATIFNSLEEKREYVRRELIERGKWKMPTMQQEISNKSPSSEILQSEMQMGSLVVPKNEITKIINDNKCKACQKEIITEEIKIKEKIRNKNGYYIKTIYRHGYKSCCNEKCYDKFVCDILSAYSPKI